MWVLYDKEWCTDETKNKKKTSSSSEVFTIEKGA